MTKETFATRITELRKKRNISQQQLAYGIGITRQSLGRYESSERTADIEILARIAEYFNVSTDYLLGRADEPFADPDDAAICKKLGIEGETLEVLKKIFYNEFDDPTPPRVIEFWNDLDEIMDVSEVAELFFQTLVDQHNYDGATDINLNFFFCLKRYMLAFDNHLNVTENIDISFVEAAGKALKDRDSDFISKNGHIFVETSKAIKDAKLRLDAAGWNLQESLMRLLYAMRGRYANEESSWQA